MKDPEGVEEILKDSSKDPSWTSMGILQGFKRILKHLEINSIRISSKIRSGFLEGSYTDSKGFYMISTMNSSGIRNDSTGLHVD